MTVTEVKIYTFDSGERESSLRAYADVTIDNAILIKGFGLLHPKMADYLLVTPLRKEKMECFTTWLIQNLEI